VQERGYAKTQVHNYHDKCRQVYRCIGKLV
jgi:hypothetical protein